MYTLKRIWQERTKFGAGILLIAFSCFILIKVANSNTEKALQNEFSYKVNAYFKHCDGLLVGAPVRLAGIRIGTVTDMTLHPEKHFSAEVTLQIDRKIELPSDSSAAIQTDGFFGAKFIELDIGGDDDVIKPGGTITYSQESILLDDLIETVIDMAKSSQQKKLKKEGQTPDET